MKIVMIILGTMTLFLSGCHEKTIGCLITENAEYEPNTLTIPRELDPVADAKRIKNQAPWVSYAMQGYEGTQQIMFSVESVTSTAGEEEATKFMEELKIRGGGGALEYPLVHKAGPGTYTVSVRLTNPGYSQVVENAFTFIIE
ncbi:hypothetical protein [Butyricimonas paravirosa]